MKSSPQSQRSRFGRIGVAAALILVWSGCGPRLLHRETLDRADTARLDRGARYLKAHMMDGALNILSRWALNEGDRQLTGSGVRYDANRDTAAVGELVVPIDSVALFETNSAPVSPAIVPVALLSTASLALTTYCQANPKECFGSCPTFYVASGDTGRLVAEGFSSSIAPCLEATDIDAIGARSGAEHGDTVRITMKDEALETHVVRSVALLACAAERGERVFALPDGAFRRVDALLAPARCVGPEGDCTTALAALDGIERASRADSFDLGAREEIELDFGEPPAGDWGLVISSRQTLLSTFLFYRTLASMGETAGEWFAALERGDERARGAVAGLENALGGIDVLLRNERGAWDSVASVREAGPLATDTRAIPFPAGTSPSRIRLRLTRGLWRIDAVAIARLGEPREPLRLAPSSVLRDGERDPDALARLSAPTAVPPAGTTQAKPLVMMPGDAVMLVFEIPRELGNTELFLESRGYYLEWMREEWLEEHDAERVAQILFAPAEALRALAPEFKSREASMEAAFWGSRFAKP